MAGKRVSTKSLKTGFRHAPVQSVRRPRNNYAHGRVLAIQVRSNTEPNADHNEGYFYRQPEYRLGTGQSIMDGLQRRYFFWFFTDHFFQRGQTAHHRCEIIPYCKVRRSHCSWQRGCYFYKHPLNDNLTAVLQGRTRTCLAAHIIPKKGKIVTSGD